MQPYLLNIINIKIFCDLGVLFVKWGLLEYLIESWAFWKWILVSV